MGSFYTPKEGHQIGLFEESDKNLDRLSGLTTDRKVFGVNFTKILKQQVHIICGQVHLLKNAMLAYGKNMPRNNQFSVFYPEMVKNCPEKNLPKIEKMCPG